jgi:hypothetical protein
MLEEQIMSTQFSPLSFQGRLMLHSKLEEVQVLDSLFAKIVMAAALVEQ